ncbi:hypothetical protein BC830DRAFT_1156265 [Chytriomyces sp. MP71]|nr:hypothetical protein BC830DRAFT_1156265 [Chytriomyces sp. MP71]
MRTGALPNHCAEVIELIYGNSYLSCILGYKSRPQSPSRRDVKSANRKTISVSDLMSAFRPSVVERPWRPSSGKSMTGNKIADTKEDALISGIAQALFRFGAPLSRVEQRALSVAQALEVPLTIQCLPQIIMISFGDGSERHPTRTHFLKVPFGFNVGKLDEVDQLALQIIDSSYLPSESVRMLDWGSTEDMDFLDEAMKKLDRIVARPRTYSRPFKIMCGGMQCSIMAMLAFAGSPGDGILAFLLGSLSSAFIELNATYSVQGVDELLVSIVIASLSRLLQRFWPGNYLFIYPNAKLSSIMQFFEGTPACQSLFSLSALLQLYPGMTITLGMLELGDNPVSGSVRMFQSFIRSLKLGFGLAIGAELGVQILQLFSVSNPSFGGGMNSPTCPTDSSELYMITWERLAYAFLYALGNYVSLEARPSQFWKVVCAALMSFFVFTLARNLNSVDVAAGIAAFVVAACANVWSRVMHEIGVPFTVSGVLFLVPGSLGVNGAAKMFMTGTQMASGSAFGIDMISRSMAIALGIYVANRLVFATNPEQQAKLIEKTMAF